MKEHIERLAALAERLLRPGIFGQVIRPDKQLPRTPEGRRQVVCGVCAHCGKLHTMRLCVTPISPRQGVPSLNAFGGFGVCVVALLMPLMLGGCASLRTWAAAHEGQLSATGQVLAQVAARAALNAAVNAVDERSKSETLRALAGALRQQSGAVVTADDVAKIITAWAPNDGEVWQRLSARVAAVAAEELAGRSRADAAKVVNAIADGLEQAAANAANAAGNVDASMASAASAATREGRN